MRFKLLTPFFLSVVLLVSCNKGSEPIKEVTISFSIPSLEITQNSSDLIGGRSEGVPDDWNHILQGTGELLVTNTLDGSTISISLDSDQLTSSFITLPVGSYDFLYTVDSDKNCGYSEYLPYIGFANDVNVNQDQQVITLAGQTTWDLILVKDQNLCEYSYSGGTFNGVVFWDADGDGLNSSGSCNIILNKSGNYFYTYTNDELLSNIPKLWIHYDDANSECQQISIERPTEGAKVFLYIVQLSGVQGFSIDLDGIFTTEEVVLGVG